LLITQDCPNTVSPREHKSLGHTVLRLTHRRRRLEDEPNFTRQCARCISHPLGVTPHHLEAKSTFFTRIDIPLQQVVHPLAGLGIVRDAVAHTIVGKDGCKLVAIA